MFSIEYKKLFKASKIAKLDLETHKYSFKNDRGEQATANFSVTEILNKGVYITKTMEVAAAVGSHIHENFAALCDAEGSFALSTSFLSSFALLPLLPERQKISDIEDHIKNKCPIAHACFQAVSANFAPTFKMIEKPLVGEFEIEGEILTVGGTADLVLLEKIDCSEPKYILNVLDLKTATGESIQANWRIQVAVYLEFYRKYFESQGFKIEKTRGYVIRPGFNRPIIVVTEQNQRQLVDAFALKLCAARIKEITITSKEKETIATLREAIDSVSETEKKLLTMAKEAKDEKEKLLNMLSATLSKIQSHSPYSALKDGEFLISPSVTTLTLADTEYLKFKNPEGYCKTSSKVSLTLCIDNAKYSVEVV